MKYILTMFQEGGCDYTVGCGYKWILFEAPSREKAVEQALETVEDYGGSERFENISLKEYDYNVNILEMLKMRENADKIALEKEFEERVEKEERETLAQLKKKYEQPKGL